jgi:hypothetical protein
MDIISPLSNNLNMFAIYFMQDAVKQIRFWALQPTLIKNLDPRES